MLDHCLNYVKSKYEKYKGYSDTITPKVQEHHRQTTATSTSLEIRDNAKVTFTREAFLENPNNKEQLVKLLCARLEKCFSAIQCKGGADVSIVKSGIEFVDVGKNVVVVHCVKRVRIRSYSGPQFSRIQTEYGEILPISPYSVRMRGKCGPE